MAISRYAAVTDAILTTLRADATLTAAAVEIVDGPPIQQAYGSTVLYVGWSGEADNPTSGTISQQYHDTGTAAKRDEVVEVYCLIQTARGDDDMSTARTDATAALGAIESALRTTPALGLADVIRVEMSDSSVKQIRDGLGLAFEHAFTITTTSLI